MNLEQVYSILEPKLNFLGQIYICGGAVRDTLLGRKPKDFDLFILSPPSALISFPNKFKDFCKLELSLITFDNDLDFHKSEPFLLTNIKLEDVDVQIMHRDLGSIDELINTFDFDLCYFAYGKEGYIKKGDLENIKMGNYLKINKITYPASTLRRAFRFSERFGMQIKKEDLKKLCGLVYLKDNKEDYNI